MIRRILNRFRAAPSGPAMCWPDRPVAIIGDVHGRLDLLTALLDRLEQDPDLPADHDLVLVGDLIDRGPDSLGVIDLVRARESARPDRVTALRGNHEAMMLDFLRGAENSANWLRHGGAETLDSLGLSLLDLAMLPEKESRAALQTVQDTARDALGVDRLKWLEQRPYVFTSGDVIAVHGAFDRARAPEDQDPDHVIWGARDFYRRHLPGPPWIVHGHVITRPPAIHGGRIAIDSGAWLGGGLTAAVMLPGAAPRFVQVGA